MTRWLAVAGLSVLLVACVVGVYLTADLRPAARQKSEATLIDEVLLLQARQLAGQAETAEELALAREANRSAAHELDGAFAAELRANTASPVPLKGTLRKLAEHIVELKARIGEEEQAVAKLTPKAADDEDVADRLELAKAQLSLDKYELDEAKEDLARQGGDRHRDLEKLRQRYEAAQKQEANLNARPVSAPNPETLILQVRELLSLREKRQKLEAARKQAEDIRSTLQRDHDRLEKLSSGTPRSDDLVQLTKLAEERKTLAELDRRIQDCQQIEKEYRQWETLADERWKAVWHLLLRSLVLLLGIALAVVLVHSLVLRTFSSEEDRRRRLQLRALVTVAVRVVAVLLALFVIFGLPSQLSTMLGLATAGVTVVMKDFIVSFLGWFLLMGRHGIHVGDWVEIEGVGGEVVEIGMFRTVLLEVGNWTDKGHPTGRRVSFSNSFAVEDHYFNFSTQDQWLWDELVVSLPGGADPYVMAQKILQVVQQATETDSQLAEQDWAKATHQYGTRQFSAKPAVDIRPSMTGPGLDVRVRYITRAPQRYEVKSRLFEKIVELLHAAPVEA